ncbi:MAG: hypothetical protein JXR95_09980 [Deltaproteobacteria bacterium]|nr:hypothetical protein [Deltaproteobacteria bacterium]
MKTIKFTAVILLLTTLSSCDDSGSSKMCGNGNIDENEECDTENLFGQTCETLGYYGGNLSCNDQCTFDTTSCELAGICGDGTIQNLHEECDETDLAGASCESKGYRGGTLGCDNSCHFDYSGCFLCGNGTIESGEECEGSNLDDESCATLGYYGGVLACNTADCTFNTTGCESFGYCGDGIIQSGYLEECEGANLGSATNCRSIDSMYYEEDVPLVCTDACKFDTSMCRFCGDGLIDADMGELCDLENLGDTPPDCSTYLSGGTCNELCGFDECTEKIYQTISTGNSHTCAIDSNGKVWCWGNNLSGQLGNNSIQSSDIPEEVILEEQTTINSADGGDNSTCALDDSGDAWCWGSNLYGQLGNNETTDSLVPVEVEMPAGITFTAISTGSYFSCAIDTEGQIWCWGSNNYGQLGNNLSVNSPVPVEIHNPDNKFFTSLNAGSAHVCALDDSGKPWCWGSNLYGQLGINTTNDSPVPVAVLIQENLILNSISCSDGNSCALDNSGNAWCWGRNNYGQIGNNSTLQALTPKSVDMPESTSFSSIGAGKSHNCALDTSGNAWCWGANNLGQLGIDSTSGWGYPVEVHMPENTTFSAISTGVAHNCALADNNRVWCWGFNSNGQLGVGDSVTRTLPALTMDPQ